MLPAHFTELRTLNEDVMEVWVTVMQMAGRGAASIESLSWECAEAQYQKHIVEDEVGEKMWPDHVNL